jgi:hypothetical protein
VQKHFEMARISHRKQPRCTAQKQEKYHILPRLVNCVISTSSNNG